MLEVDIVQGGSSLQPNPHVPLHGPRHLLFQAIYPAVEAKQR